MSPTGNEYAIATAMLWATASVRRVILPDLPDGCLSASPDAARIVAAIREDPAASAASIALRVSPLLSAPSREALGAGAGATAATLRGWIDAAKREAHRRDLAEAMRLARMQLDAGGDAETAESVIDEARRQCAADYGTPPSPLAGAAVDEFLEWRADLAARRKAGTCPTFGIAAIDRRAIWVPSYGLVLARTSAGKTAFALSVVYSLACQDTPSLFFSLEQPRYMIAARLLCLYLGRPLSTLIEGDPADHKTQRAVEWLKAAPITIADGRHTAAQIAAESQRARDAGRADVVFIDQMSCIAHDYRERESKEQAWTRTSNALRRLWQDLAAPVVLLAQLNVKDGKDHPRPSASQVKDCGSMLEDCCWAIVLDRPDAEPERAESMREKAAVLRTKGHSREAEAMDPTGAVWATLAKDRNAAMGGTWRERLAFDALSGQIKDPGHSVDYDQFGSREEA